MIYIKYAAQCYRKEVNLITSHIPAAIHALHWWMCDHTYKWLPLVCYHNSLDITCGGTGVGGGGGSGHQGALGPRAPPGKDLPFSVPPSNCLGLPVTNCSVTWQAALQNTRAQYSSDIESKYKFGHKYDLGSNLRAPRECVCLTLGKCSALWASGTKLYGVFMLHRQLNQNPSS